MEGTIVFYPSPERSHLVSMVELAKLILKHHPGFSITIIISTPPFDTGSIHPYIASVSATTSSIAFHHLPPVSLPATTTAVTGDPVNIKVQIFEFAKANNDNPREALLNLSKSSNLRAFIIDFFCHAAADVSSILNIPTYYFVTGSARSLAILLHFPCIHDNTTNSLKEALIAIPGLSPIPAKDMPLPMLDRTRKIYGCFLQAGKKMPKSAGIILNTVEGLERRALQAISSGQCLPEGISAPPIYCIGPLFATGEETTRKRGEFEGSNNCLSWLSSQQSQSVVFLAFGSLGKFYTKQLREMAMGLERSGVRFLWVVRDPPLDDENMRALIETHEPITLESLLPSGFPERTKDRGLVVKNWAPQIDVLSHESVGGFVTLCGWNSALESVAAGVPILGWPLYADQKSNKLTLVEEWKVALPLGMSEEGFVAGTELEERVRELMETERGADMRERAIGIRDIVVAAMGDGGSSRVALTELVKSFMQNQDH